MARYNELDRQFHGSLNLWMKTREPVIDTEYALKLIDKFHSFPAYGNSVDPDAYYGFAAKYETPFMYHGYEYTASIIGYVYDQKNVLRVWLVVAGNNPEVGTHYSAVLTDLDDQGEMWSRSHGIVDFNGKEIFQHYDGINAATKNLLKEAAKNNKAYASIILEMIEKNIYLVKKEELNASHR